MRGLLPEAKQGREVEVGMTSVSFDRVAAVWEARLRFGGKPAARLPPARETTPSPTTRMVRTNRSMSLEPIRIYVTANGCALMAQFPDRLSGV